MSKLILREKYLKIFNRMDFPFVMFLTVLFLYCFAINETAANVCPENTNSQEISIDLFNFSNSHPRNFNPQSKAPGLPFPAKKPLKPANGGNHENRCFLKESFRLLADRGNSIGIIIFFGSFSFILAECNPLEHQFHSIINITRIVGSSRIRPPPEVLFLF